MLYSDTSHTTVWYTAESASYSSCRLQILDINDFIGDAAAAIVNDSFSRCFQSQPLQSWNWNPYLFVFSALGTGVKFFLFLVKCVPADLVLTALLSICVCVCVCVCVYVSVRERRVERERERERERRDPHDKRDLWSSMSFVNISSSKLQLQVDAVALQIAVATERHSMHLCIFVIHKFVRQTATRRPPKYM
jgi:hypothetical protein